MSRMLEALRRVEDRRQDGQDTDLLVRPRRVQPAPAAPLHDSPPPAPAVPGPKAGEPMGPAIPHDRLRPAAATAPDGFPPADQPAPTAESAPTAEPAPTADPATTAESAPAAESPRPQQSPGTEARDTARPGPAGRLDAQFHELAARVLARVPAQQPAVVGFCALGAEAYAAVAPLVAAMVQQLPGDIVLIEADVRPSSLAERLGTLAGRHLRIPQEVLRTGTGWASLTRPTGIARLSLLPGMREVLLCAPRPSGVSPWETAVEELCQRHALVLVVAGPPPGPAGLGAFQKCDGVFVLATVGHTGIRQTRHTIESLRRAGRSVWGVILVDPWAA